MENLLVDQFTLSLNRSRGRYTLAMNEIRFEQNICEFLLTFSFLQSKDIEAYLMNTASEYDQVRVPLSGCGKNTILPLSDFIRLREVYANEMFELKLEDLLLRQGVALARH